MTGCRDMDKKHQKYPKNGGFPPFVTPQRFVFKNRALSLLYPYGALTSCKKLEKTNEQSLRYLKMDGRTTDQRPRTRAITKDPLRRTWGPKWSNGCNKVGQFCYKQNRTIKCVRSISFANRNP